MSQPKPTFNTLWGSTGATADPGDAKISQGWTVEIPPHEWQNFWQLRVDQFLQHINQQGVCEWDAVTDYPINGWAKGSDGSVYQSNVNPNAGNDPTSSPAEWTRIFGFFTQDTTLNILSTHTHAEIQAIYSSIGHVADGVQVEVVWEAGSYGWAAGEFLSTSASGTGQIVTRIEAGQETGANNPLKNATITGEGGVVTGSATASNRALFHDTSSCAHIVQELKFVLTDAAVADVAACAVSFYGRTSFDDCAFDNQTTAGDISQGVFAARQGGIVTSGCDFTIATGPTRAATHGSSNGSWFTAIGPSGSAPYGFFVNRSDSARTGSTVTTSIAVDLISIGEIYT
jgi:hypothetical protein